MNQQVISIRPFIGAKKFDLSRNFYKDMGFLEAVISKDMSYFSTQGFGFYLQDAYVKDWVDNTMLFLEVEDVEKYWETLVSLDLTTKYATVKLIPVRNEAWGKECFVHDPSGILWHIGTFRKQ
jgi:hypothetical protein